MPHQCTGCGRAFDDGSKEMLSGCPDCGGNKFQFLPADAVDDLGAATGTSNPTAGGTPTGDSPDASSGSSAGEAHEPEPDSPGAVDRAAATVRDWVSRGEDAAVQEGSTSTGEDAAIQDGATTELDGARENAGAREDAAQASARTDVVSEAELPDEAPIDALTAPAADPTSAGPDADVVDAPVAESPDLSELREELNSQFESIRITEPGQYELNLMELYERDEYIIALQEDGKYVIEVPDAWDPEER